MNTWFKVSINGGEGFMLLTDGVFVGYYDAAGQQIYPDPGSTVYVIENDVIGPF
jgi:hypothetical protein